MYDRTGSLSIEDVWRHDRSYLLGMANRMLGDAAAAEDVLQEAFSRLARVDLDEIDDMRGFLAVVVRRLCLDRLRSAHARHESPAGEAWPLGQLVGRQDDGLDPADRVTLDDQVQLALGVVLDRLTPAERTSFVLHDVFGFPFTAVAEMVGRTPAACRQLASRARRSIRTTAPVAPVDTEITESQLVTERFIAACAGGDITELMAVLDPDIEGVAKLIGGGELARARGRHLAAWRLVALFGPLTERRLQPVVIEGGPAVVAVERGVAVALLQLEVANGVVHHIHAFVTPPHQRRRSA
jgi:RNA polymerase sigma-70 factor, ECF subfamily